MKNKLYRVADRARPPVRGHCPNFQKNSDSVRAADAVRVRGHLSADIFDRYLQLLYDFDFKYVYIILKLDLLCFIIVVLNFVERPGSYGKCEFEISNVENY